MPVRRAANPNAIQHVWDAIRVANMQRQMADMPRIVKYLQRVCKCTQSQAESYIQQSLKDGLIVELHKVTVKGSKAGTEVDSYKIPVQELPLPNEEKKDWYCIECHLAGDVVLCRSCHRVYHSDCIKNEMPIDLTPATITEKSPISNSPPPAITEEANLTNSESVVAMVSNKTDEQETKFPNITDDLERKLEILEGGFMNNSNSSESSDVNLSTAENTETDKTNEECSGTCESSVSLTEKDKYVYDLTLCSICNMFGLESNLPLEKDELNHLLMFVHHRIKSWIPASITDTVPPDAKPECRNESEIKWRVEQLFYQPMNMSIIEKKLQQKEYTHVCDFKADVLTVRHNIAVYHGVESQEYECAKFLWNDAHRELSELSNCVDCYKHSNEKINHKWFCLPCRVPHKLVWAKQKGYPYWPAKVIKETSDSYDVRFFGGKYERSILQKIYVKPVTVNMKIQHTKKNATLNKSVEELLLHQKLLGDPLEVAKFIAESRKRRTTATPKAIRRKSANSKAVAKTVTKLDKQANTDLSKDVYSFDDSSSSLDVQGIKRKRSSSVSKPGTSRLMEYPTRSVIQNQVKKNKIANNGNQVENSVINLSSDYDELEEFSTFEDYEFEEKKCDGGHQEVSSSTEHNQSGDETFVRDNSDALMPQTERQYSEAVEKARRKLEQCPDKKQLIKVALECMQAEIDRIKDTHDDYLKKVFEAHNSQISETKRKQWCFNCEQDAIYHCCWNTAYCSPTCQQQHWQAEHKKVCRRKR